MAAVADSNDLTSNWRKIRLKPISLPALLSILILLLPQPQNAMPIPKIQQNSLTSAMVSFKMNLPTNPSNQTLQARKKISHNHATSTFVFDTVILIRLKKVANPELFTSSPPSNTLENSTCSLINSKHVIFAEPLF